MKLQLSKLALTSLSLSFLASIVTPTWAMEDRENAHGTPLKKNDRPSKRQRNSTAEASDQRQVDLGGHNVRLKDFLEQRRSISREEWREKGLGSEVTLYHPARFHWKLPFAYKNDDGPLDVMLTTELLYPEEILEFGKQALSGLTQENYQILLPQLRTLAVQTFNESMWDRENWKFFHVESHKICSFFWEALEDFSNGALIHALQTWSNNWELNPKAGTYIFLLLEGRFSSFRKEDTYDFFEKIPLHLIQSIKIHDERVYPSSLNRISKLLGWFILSDTRSDDQKVKDRARKILERTESVLKEGTLTKGLEGFCFPDDNVYIPFYNGKSPDNRPIAAQIPSSSTINNTTLIENNITINFPPNSDTNAGKKDQKRKYRRCYKRFTFTKDGKVILQNTLKTTRTEANPDQLRELIVAMTHLKSSFGPIDGRAEASYSHRIESCNRLLAKLNDAQKESLSGQ
ncbi:MAG: hypothetical protein BGO67_07225 [Alphaproteobacteria bacterium 41-28]|nr:MAG: hypothetical protein BGO67_07225 [Alphaproteobacteria bacterium 41-28]